MAKYGTPEWRKNISIARSKNSVFYFCDNCSIECSTSVSKYARYKQHFCGQACYSAWIKKQPYWRKNAYKGVRAIGESRQVYHRRYAKNHPENMKHLKARRYARERGAAGKHTLAEWIELKQQFDNKCAICREAKPLTKDHIIPLSHNGSDNIQNIQPLCRNCNSQKHNRVHEHPHLLEQ